MQTPDDSANNTNTFVLSRTALIETYPRVEFIYGRWDAIFGAWIVRRGVAREYVPQFGLHFESGFRPAHVPCQYCLYDEYFYQGSETDLAMRQAECNCIFAGQDPLEEDSPVAVEELPEPVKAYGRMIPVEVRRATDFLSKHAWLGLEACWDDPAFIALLATLTLRRYVTCVWTLANAGSMGRRARRELNKALVTKGPAQLLHLHLTSVSSHVVMYVLKRLAEEYVDEAVLSSAITAASRQKSTKWLRHIRNIPAAALAEISGLPDWARLPVCVAGLVRGGSAIRDFRETLEQLAGQLDASSIASLKARLPTVTRPEDLQDIAQDLEIRILRNSRFPPPPIKSNEQFEAISCFDHLWEEGVHMRNCCAGYLKDILAGRLYFYRWHGAERATVCLEAVSQRWGAAEIVLFKNGPPSQATISQIQELIKVSQRPCVS